MPKARRKRRDAEAGIALLIAIFVLLLVSVVAIALIVSSGTETALGANYRASSTVYYSALAGLEEARGRLLPKNPSYLGLSIPISTPMALGQTIYIYNGLTGETVSPWDSGNPYYDTEYFSEFNPTQASASSWQSVPSLWNNNAQGMPGPIYKWVRINPVTEKSLYIDVNQDGTYDSSTPIYYDPAQVDSSGNPLPSLISSVSPPPTASQVLEITALAQMPNGSKKILQYLVAPAKLNLTFPAALTLDGTNVGTSSTDPFTLPTSTSFYIDGNDQYSPGSCVPGATSVPAIGYSTTGGGDTSQSTITSAIATAGAHNSNYPGLGASPSVGFVGAGAPPPGLALPAGALTVGGLNQIVQSLTQNADLVLTGPLTQSDATNYFPGWMSATKPATVVVNGDFTLNAWHSTGYGILLVTGKLTYDPDAYWDGIILVIGKGIMYAYQGGVGQVRGAVFLASTVDDSGNPLSNSSAPGSSSFDFTAGAGSTGIYYSSCWIQYVNGPMTYKVLSFHEIPQ